MPTHIALMNQIVNLNTMKHVVRTWTITSLKSRYLQGFLKLGYNKKIIKDNMIQSILSFHNLQKIIQSLTHIVFSIILYKFSSKVRVLFLFQASFKKFKSETIWVDSYCRYRKIRSTFIKNTYGSLLNFFQYF